MNVRTLFRRRLRRGNRVGDRALRLDDVGLLRQVRILRLFNHVVGRASVVPPS